jgi:hypothetical protein
MALLTRQRTSRGFAGEKLRQRAWQIAQRTAHLSLAVDGGARWSCLGMRSLASGTTLWVSESLGALR